MLLVSETGLVLTVAFLTVVGADINCSFVVAGSRCGFVDTGCLAVSLHGATALTLRVDWQGCSTLAEKPPVVRLYDGLHIPGATV